MSSAYNFTVEETTVDISLMYITNKMGPKIVPEVHLILPESMTMMVLVSAGADLRFSLGGGNSSVR